LLLGAQKSQLTARMRMANNHAPVLSDTKLAYGLGGGSAFGAAVIERAELTMRSTDHLSEIEVRFSTTTPMLRPDVITQLPRALVTVGMPEGLAALFEVKETRPQRELLATFSVAGGDAAQRKQIGDVVAFGVNYVRDYIAHAKSAEAQLQLRLLAQNAKVTFDSARMRSAKPGSKLNCGLAAPLTPAGAPRGIKYQSSAADWAAPGWKALTFSIDDPQYYAYGIDRSSDGQVCIFYALGDLNGDGNPSRFSLEARVTKDAKGMPSLTVARDIVEVNPLE
jgi:hypothetical protein